MYEDQCFHAWFFNKFNVAAKTEDNFNQRFMSAEGKKVIKNIEEIFFSVEQVICN